MYSGCFIIFSVRLIKTSGETDLTTDPTDEKHDHPNGLIASVKNEHTPDQTDQTRNSQREPTPIEFVVAIRELFREIRELIVFLRNWENANAALIFLTSVLAIATVTQAIIYTIQLGPLRKSASAAQLAAEAAKEQADSTERSLAVTSAAYCNAGTGLNGPPPTHIFIYIVCGKDKVYATLLDGTVEITTRNLRTDAKIGESQKFTLKSETLKPGIGGAMIPFDIPRIESSYTEIKESFEYDDGFKHTLPSSFCTDIIPLRIGGGKEWTTTRAECSPQARRDAMVEKKRLELMGHEKKGTSP